ncbi:MAG: DUF4870 domain-containing protein [Sumerlaeia bacterium]
MASNFGGTVRVPLTPPDSDEKLWAQIAQLGSLAGYVLSGGLLNFVVPGVIYLVYQDKSEYVRRNALESLGWQVGMLVAKVLAGLAIFICIGVVLLPLVVVLEIFYVIIATMRANEGKIFEYPVTSSMLSSFLPPRESVPEDAAPQPAMAPSAAAQPAPPTNPAPPMPPIDPAPAATPSTSELPPPPPVSEPAQEPKADSPEEPKPNEPNPEDDEKKA